MKKYFITLCLSILFATSSYATTYYVSTSGNDGNSCSSATNISTPKRNITSGVTCLGPGDTLLIRSGVYAESFAGNDIPSGTSWSSPVTLAAYPGETVTMRPGGGNRVITLLNPQQYIVIDGLKLDGINVTFDGIKITCGSGCTAFANHIRVQNVEIMNAATQGLLVDGDFNEFKNLKVHDSGTRCDGLGQCHGIYVEGANNLIENSEFYNITGCGVHIYNGSNSGGAHDNIIRNNFIHDNGSSRPANAGIILSSGLNNIAYNNIIVRSRIGIDITFNAVNNQVYNNTVYGNDVGGIDTSVFAGTGSVIRNNIVFNNGAGIDDNRGGAFQSNNLITNPQFVNPGGDDFHLSSGSGAIDAGVTIALFNTDIAGTIRPQGSAYDIGAYEFGATPPPPSFSVYYVDPVTGLDTNTGGSTATPWKTLPGTRTITNSGFLHTAWGNVTVSAKIQCGVTILLKGGTTHTSAIGGAWRIDNGQFNDGTGFYALNCASPITIKVATSAQWAGSNGPFTFNGTGITPTCLAWCNDQYALIHIQDVSNIILGGISATQRFVVSNATILNFPAHNIIVTSSDITPLINKATLQYIDSSSAKSDGIAAAFVDNSIIKQVITHNNTGSGISTGFSLDKVVRNIGFEDIEAYSNGPPTSGNVGDQFQFLGCESCYLIRAKSHDGYLRGLNYRSATSFGDMSLLIRDSEFWNNGLSTDNTNVYQSGPCVSGSTVQTQYAVIERSIIALNREAGGPCVSNSGWADIWNSVFWHNGLDKTVGGIGDIAVSSTMGIRYLGVMNSVVQKRPDNITWTNTAPAGAGTVTCPVSDYSTFHPVASDSEQLSDFNCQGGTVTAQVMNYAQAKPSFLGPHTGIGTSATINFVRTDDTVYANNDFHIQSPSSAIASGTTMFRAASSGTGTTINVLGNGGSNDPRKYFISPASYYQALGDTIQITGCGQVIITSMTASTISFTPSCSWSANAGIHFPWIGSAPDRGVYTFTGVIATPLSLRTLISR